MTRPEMANGSLQSRTAALEQASCNNSALSTPSQVDKAQVVRSIALSSSVGQVPSGPRGPHPPVMADPPTSPGRFGGRRVAMRPPLRVTTFLPSQVSLPAASHQPIPKPPLVESAKARPRGPQTCGDTAPRAHSLPPPALRA